MSNCIRTNSKNESERMQCSAAMIEHQHNPPMEGVAAYARMKLNFWDMNDPKYFVDRENWKKRRVKTSYTLPKWGDDEQSSISSAEGNAWGAVELHSKDEGNCAATFKNCSKPAPSVPPASLKKKGRPLLIQSSFTFSASLTATTAEKAKKLQLQKEDVQHSISSWMSVFDMFSATAASGRPCFFQSVFASPLRSWIRFTCGLSFHQIKKVKLCHSQS